MGARSLSRWHKVTFQVTYLVGTKSPSKGVCPVKYWDPQPQLGTVQLLPVTLASHSVILGLRVTLLPQ